MMWIGGYVHPFGTSIGHSNDVCALPTTTVMSKEKNNIIFFIAAKVRFFLRSQEVKEVKEDWEVKEV